MTVIIKLLLFAVCLALVAGDCYMHWPRGSNNRLNGNNENRDQNNRLFDSQNNNKGGYCWGPPMYYYVGSLLSVEWTNQHECGSSSDKTNCDVVLQYMCAPINSDESGGVRDGTSEEQIRNNAGTYNLQDASGGYLYGMHEDFEYYQHCSQRERNKGLFTADQGVSNNQGARATRQNPGGGRSGFECPEERDYWPYWNPTPWKDIAVLTSRTDKCDFFTGESQNVRSKGNCSDPKFGQESLCRASGATFTQVPSWGMAAPQCLPAPFSRDNHLGNGAGGYPNTYNWTIPNTPAKRCVLRIRYNITTADGGAKDYYDLRASENGPNSPVKQDPYLPFLGRLLRLAIDTTQFGRTFQDRSHVFEIRSRPSSVDGSKRIHNLGVRGKRGNIVQAYPAVEYDFQPNILNVRTGDLIHIQWTGCDNNPAGNQGEGRQKTDRSNIVALKVLRGNKHLDYLNTSSLTDVNSGIPQFWSNAQAQLLAHVGQSGCLRKEEIVARNPNNGGAQDQDPQNCAKLNAGSRYFDGGVVEISTSGSFKYISSRNNNFSNRSQKATINSDNLIQTFGIVLLSISGAAFAAAIVVAIVIKVAPGSALASAAVGV